LQRGLCSVANRGGGSQIVSIDVDITPSECEAMDGTYADSVQWVLNTWVAPGWENTAGVFSKENPRLSCVIEAYVQWLGTAKGTGAAPGPEATAALADDLQACGRPAS
jgi:hypothetical protein